jgi:fatty-acyl-CoA synthase
VASAWRQLGVQRGDRIVWRGPNHPAFLESWFAASKLGAALAPVNHLIDDAVAADLVERYSPSVIVEHDVAPLAVRVGLRARIAVGEATPGADAAFEDVARSPAEVAVDEPVAPDEPCLIPHTSGTTGSPRGVVLTHRNVTANVVNVLSAADLRGDDVTIAVAPFFRTGGTGVNVMPVLFKGGTVVVPGSSGPEEVLRLVEEERVTVGFAGPDLLDALVRSPRWPAVDLTSLRWFLTGGAPVPEHLIRTYRERGVTFLQGYGLSEAAPVVLLLDADHSLEKLGSAGVPPMFVDIRTTRSDGTSCAPGETGELRVQGPNVMAGYWGDDGATGRVIDGDGWLRTGDAARVDDDGYVWIVDRMSDAFEVAGHRVFPGDVERALLEHPGVRDAGVTVDGAFVVLEPGATATADELRRACRDRLDPVEVPARIVVVTTLPRSSVGKLLRHQLRMPS